MTETAWLTLTKLDPLLSHVAGEKSVRRLTLFGCACCRCAQDWSLPPLEARAIEATERHADGEITRATWRKQGRALETERGLRTRSLIPWEHDFRNAVIQIFYASSPLSVPHALLRAVNACSTAEYAAAFEAKLCSVVRDLFGNPFRVVAFAPAWRTDAVVALARTMYESRDFSAMPILADALQEVGCDNDDILNHCRDIMQVHVRGCWVVDGVLGKT